MVAKEAALNKESQEQQKLLKEKEDLQVEMEKVKEETKSIRQKKKEVEKNFNMASDKNKLLQQELSKCKGQLEQALRERSKVNRKLSKKIEEHELLERKAAIQEKVLNRGEGKYQERIEDIRVLKLEVKRLRQEENLMTKSTIKMDELRKEVLRLQKELLKEKTKGRAMQDELETPLNVHRWRKLEGSDPSTFDLIQKIQALQKRLIARKEELTEKDLNLTEKERIIMELRGTLARVPVSEDLQEEVKQAKEEVNRRKDIQIAVVAENNMLKTQLQELKGKLEKLTDEFHETKKRLLEMNKRHSKLKEKVKEDEEKRQTKKINRSNRPVSAYARSGYWTPKKFVGGGFNTHQSESSSHSSGSLG